MIKKTFEQAMNSMNPEMEKNFIDQVEKLDSFSDDEKTFMTILNSALILLAKENDINPDRIPAILIFMKETLEFTKKLHEGSKNDHLN